ncbi:MAG TPA: farnesyl diphosphate synthase [Abditibacteriaceae bacterium]
MTSTLLAWRVTPEVIEDALDGFLPAAREDERASLVEAMRYSVLGGGKRLRSQLVLEAAALVGGDGAIRCALPAACAVEMIHAYSLIHDDLPAMDNADVRRGKPSCHRKYGEATAILAGDALLTLAFETATRIEGSFDSGSALRAVRLIAEAAGEAGMVGGQAIDMAWSDDAAVAIDGSVLSSMHAMKTGALIRVSSEAGALLGGGDELQVAALREYGAQIGRAFQIADDLLDVAGDPNTTGKSSSDSANGKTTAPAVYGFERAQELAREASDCAVQALSQFGPEADALRTLARFVVEREK